MSAEVQGTDAGPVVGRVAGLGAGARRVRAQPGAGPRGGRGASPCTTGDGPWSTWTAARSTRTGPARTPTTRSQLVFSTTKGITAHRGGAVRAAGAARLRRAGGRLLARVRGRRQGRGHRGAAALPPGRARRAVDEPATFEDVLDWDHMVGRLAAQAPIWEPGTAHGYHAVTFGWLAGELVRRVDPAGPQRSVASWPTRSPARSALEAWIGAARRSGAPGLAPRDLAAAGGSARRGADGAGSSARTPWPAARCSWTVRSRSRASWPGTPAPSTRPSSRRPTPSPTPARWRGSTPPPSARSTACGCSSRRRSPRPARTATAPGRAGPRAGVRQHVRHGLHDVGPVHAHARPGLVRARRRRWLAGLRPPGPRDRLRLRDEPAGHRRSTATSVRSRWSRPSRRSWPADRARDRVARRWPRRWLALRRPRGAGGGGRSATR